MQQDQGCQAPHGFLRNPPLGLLGSLLNQVGLAFALGVGEFDGPHSIQQVHIVERNPVLLPEQALPLEHPRPRGNVRPYGFGVEPEGALVLLEPRDFVSRA